MTYMEQMEACVKILNSLARKPLYDFGWYLEHVPEPNDERRVNR